MVTSLASLLTGRYRRFGANGLFTHSLITRPLEPLFRSFFDATGIEVRAVYDSEAVKTVGLVNRLIAEKNQQPLGFIHACAHQDSISGEDCGTVPLLAVSPAAQGMGVGKLLMKAAEDWAKQQGYRLLHLEVFANNDKAQGFYQNLGFKAELVHMIKAL